MGLATSAVWLQRLQFEALTHAMWLQELNKAAREEALSEAAHYYSHLVQHPDGKGHMEVFSHTDAQMRLAVKSGILRSYVQGSTIADLTDPV